MTIQELVTELKKGNNSELYRILLKMMDNSNKANTAPQVRIALDEAFHEDTGSSIINDQLENRTYAALQEAVRQGLIAAGPNPPPHKAKTVTSLETP